MTATIVGRFTFQRESLKDVRAEVEPLLKLHFAEIAHFRDIPLDVDWATYGDLERTGSLLIFTVRDGGALCGYCAVVVKFNLHYAASCQAVQDVVYLVPSLRKQMIGARFLEWVDEQLRAEKVQVVYHHVKHTHDFGPTLKRLGYESIETVWGKRLDRVP